MSVIQDRSCLLRGDATQELDSFKLVKHAWCLDLPGHCMAPEHRADNEVLPSVVTCGRHEEFNHWRAPRKLRWPTGLARRVSRDPPRAPCLESAPQPAGAGRGATPCHGAVVDVDGRSAMFAATTARSTSANGQCTAAPALQVGRAACGDVGGAFAARPPQQWRRRRRYRTSPRPPAHGRGATGVSSAAAPRATEGSWRPPPGTPRRLGREVSLRHHLLSGP